MQKTNVATVLPYRLHQKIIFLRQPIMKPEVIIISIASDNYCYLIRSGNDAAVIDPAESDPVMAEVEKGI